MWREEQRNREERELRNCVFKPEIAKTSRVYIRYT